MERKQDMENSGFIPEKGNPLWAAAFSCVPVPHRTVERSFPAAFRKNIPKA